MVEGVDQGALERALSTGEGSTCVAPLAIGALKLPGQVIVLRRYLGARRPSAIVLGVSDGTLLATGERGEPTEMVGNRAVELLWSNAEERRLLYPDATLDTFDARLRHTLLLGTSLGSYGSLAWISVQALQDRVAGDAGTETNRFGRVADMMALEHTFRDGALAALERSDGRFQASPWFERALALSAKERLPLFVVSVPMRSGYRQVVSESAVGRRYRAWLESELAHRSGVTFVDLSAVADDDAFIDGVHLGPKGAARFSEELAKLLRARSASETTRDSVEP
jgi:hypothetical protein